MEGSLIVSKSFRGVGVAVLACLFCIFGTLVSYSVDLVARQQLVSALEWVSLKEEEEGEEHGTGRAELFGSNVIHQVNVIHFNHNIIHDHIFPILRYDANEDKKTNVELICVVSLYCPSTICGAC